MAFNLVFPPTFAGILGAARVLMLDIFTVFHIDCIGSMSLHGRFVAIMASPWFCVAFIRLLQCIADRRVVHELGLGDNQLQSRASADNQSNTISPAFAQAIGNFVALGPRTGNSALSWRKRMQTSSESIAERLEENRIKCVYRVFFVFFAFYPLLSKSIFRMMLGCKILGPDEQ